MEYGDIEHRSFWEKPKQESACCMGGGPPMGDIKSFMIISKPMSMKDVNLLANVADIMTEKKGDKVFFEGLSYVKNVND
jgi:hypothetical protein